MMMIMMMMMTIESVKILVQDVIANRLDYCISVFYQISTASLQAPVADLRGCAPEKMRCYKIIDVMSWSSAANEIHCSLHMQIGGQLM